ncbi:hypothetical protein R5W24_005834 [Gemmata sp. JC717]|uniref:Secreted protein n=1 Tax=Gemmata algarum TaxID=2975278 RepID=A0ABU5EWN7_9BACT|nr:hypothetical protein [Gemmata algarum]MDY3556664.1 hypothetical protein [Gemmata algarum]MDY3558029.1 hypothetical protein [Gemmata algarum]
MRLPSRNSFLVATVAAVALTAGCGKKAPAPSRTENAGGAGVTPAPPVTPAAGVTPAPAEPNAALYGPELGEAFLPADASTAPLRPRKTDTVYKLSNPRIGTPKPTRFGPRPGSGQALMLDWEKVADGPNGGMTVVIRLATGKDMRVPIQSPGGDRAGTIEMEVAYRGPWTGELPKDAELYVIREEHGYGVAFRKTFKVSNSVILGTTRFPITAARAWTAEETAKLRTPPPAPPKELWASPGTGEETELAGIPEPHKFKRWTVDGGKPIVGFDYSVGGWDGESCLGGLWPLFDRDWPDHGQQRVMARPGYAVGGLTVKSNKFVDGIRVTFMRVKPDGRLDPADKYESPWCGPHGSGKKETKLGGDGRAVIGLITDKAAVLHAVGLVVQ